MKLVVQIPCLNEEESLPAALRVIPRQIQGVDEVIVLVIDDGSKDRTREVALANGADHVLRFTRHKGLASRFNGVASSYLPHYLGWFRTLERFRLTRLTPSALLALAVGI